MRTGRTVGVGLRILVAAALVIDAVVHLRLAGGYAQAGGSSAISEGTLFRAEAAAALLVALFVLLRGGRAAYAMALLVGASALAAVLLFRYVDIPAVGPFPAMYEPIWYGEKTLSAVAEGLAVLFAAIGWARSSTGRSRREPEGASGGVEVSRPA